MVLYRTHRVKAGLILTTGELLASHSACCSVTGPNQLHRVYRQLSFLVGNVAGHQRQQMGASIVEMKGQPSRAHSTTFRVNGSREGITELRKAITLLVHSSERMQITPTRANGTEDGIQERAGAGFLLSPLSGVRCAEFSRQRSVTTHVKYCQPGKLPEPWCLKFLLGFRHIGMEYP